MGGGAVRRDRQRLNTVLQEQILWVWVYIFSEFEPVFECPCGRDGRASYIDCV